MLAMHLRSSLLLLTMGSCRGYEEVSSPEYIAKTAAEKSDIIWSNLIEDTTSGDWSVRDNPIMVNYPVIFQAWTPRAA